MTTVERKAGKKERISMLLKKIIKPQPVPVVDEHPTLSGVSDTGCKHQIRGYYV